MNDGLIIHYAVIAALISVNSLGAGIGGGLITHAALNGINTQPSAKNDIFRIAVIGMALGETAVIMSLTLAILLLLGGAEEMSFYANIAKIGIAIVVCITGFVSSIASAWPAQASCISLAQQPFFGNKILRIMLITQSLIQTPTILGFIIALFIQNSLPVVTSLAHSIQSLAVGLSLGLGSIGPLIGLGYFAYTVCWALGINREIYNKLLTFTFVSEALIESPIILSFIVSLYILYTQLSGDTALLDSIAMLAASICMGLGTLGAGISSGNTATAACKQITLTPHTASSVARTSILTQGIIDTCAIYAFVLSIMILLFR